MSFFTDLFTGIIDGDWMERTVSFLVLAVITFLVACLAWFVFYLVDSSFRPTYTQDGMVAGHDFNPAHIQTTYVNNVMQTTYIPESYYLLIRVGDELDTMMVGHDTWCKYHDKDQVLATCVRGRMSGSMYVKSIQPHE